MKININKKYLYLFSISFIIISILIYFIINFNRINYIADNVKSYWINFSGKYKNNDFKIIDLHPEVRYKKIYRDLPENFIHFGNLLFFKAKKGDKIKELARKSISYTHFYKIYKLRNSIKEYNGLNFDELKKDMLIYIPYSLPPVMRDINNAEKPEIIYSRGLYFTGNIIGSEDVIYRISKFKKVGINTVVFDVKDVTGVVNYFSHVPDVMEYNTHEKRVIDNIDSLIRILKQGGIYTIARIAVFHDRLLCKKNPNFSIRSKKTGGVWNPGSSELWCDPTNKFVQDYNIQLAIELSEKGVDEIQFDYIRFPTKGNLKDAQFAFHGGEIPKDAVITRFLKKAYDEISRRNTRLSIDIFGVVAWEKEVDINRTGQRIDDLSKYCDVISPMLYPSHFNDDFDGFSDPGDEPFYFIQKGCQKTGALAKGKIIRPWLQAFGWRVSSYNEDYIIKQIAGSMEGGASGYLFWNSSCNYDIVYKALSKLASLNKVKKESAETKPSAGNSN